MNFHKRTVALAAALGFLMAPVAMAQTPAPAAPAAPRKLISPYRGDATVEFTKPVDHWRASGSRRTGRIRLATWPAATSIGIRSRSCRVR